MMWAYDGGWSAATWLLMCLLMLVFWGGLVAGVVWLTASWRGSQRVEQQQHPKGRRGRS